MIQLYGNRKYNTFYAVEHEGMLFGPFPSKSDATDFALKELDLPWTLRDVMSPIVD